MLSNPFTKDSTSSSTRQFIIKNKPCQTTSEGKSWGGGGGGMDCRKREHKDATMKKGTWGEKMQKKKIENCTDLHEILLTLDWSLSQGKILCHGCG